MEKDPRRLIRNDEGEGNGKESFEGERVLANHSKRETIQCMGTRDTSAIFYCHYLISTNASAYLESSLIAIWSCANIRS